MFSFVFCGTLHYRYSLRFIIHLRMDQSDVYRKMLTATISSMLLEQGVDTAEKECLGTLTEMLQSFMTQVGMLAKNFCELSGRSEPLIADVILAFIETGIDLSTLEHYVTGSKHTVLPALQPQQPPKQLCMLANIAGQRQPLAPHILQYLPPYPDPHAYVRTPTHKQPVIDYESVREKAATQKKDIEKALTKFLAKTGPTHNLFDTDDANMFPLIASKPAYPPYLSALLPQDQIFDPEDLEYDPRSQINPQSKRKESCKKDDKKDCKTEPAVEEIKVENIKTEENSCSSNMYIDNPYLAATKLPSNESVDMG